MKYIKSVAIFIFLYVLAFVFWWMLLLNRQEKTIFELREQIIELQDHSTNKSEETENLQNDLKQARAMILYEGLAFMFILIISGIYVFRSIVKQERLNHILSNFLLATTHELKTPLAASKLNLQTLQSKKLNKEQKNKLIESSLQQVQRLQQLVDNLLLTSKIDLSSQDFVSEKIDLSKSLVDWSNQISTDRLQLEIQPNLIVYGDTQALKIMVNNLIDNALKYSTPDSPIFVSAIENNEFVEITVLDQGVGIPENEIDAIFERFYRIGNEQTRQATGTGLGLYLVKQLARLQNASVDYEENHPKGSKFVLRFPSHE